MAYFYSRRKYEGEVDYRAEFNSLPPRSYSLVVTAKKVNFLVRTTLDSGFVLTVTQDLPKEMVDGTPYFWRKNEGVRVSQMDGDNIEGFQLDFDQFLMEKNLVSEFLSKADKSSYAIQSYNLVKLPPLLKK